MKFTLPLWLELALVLSAVYVAARMAGVPRSVVIVPYFVACAVAGWKAGAADRQ